ncbi:MAG: tetratricopeptide repeat protein [Bacteroidia bacterium]|nr:tetratricopeptide repeat protein [Bacteroidia bacterium]
MSSQINATDSLKLALVNAKQDSTRCNILEALIEADIFSKAGSVYNEQLLQIAQRNISISDPVQKRIFMEYLADAYNNESVLAQQKNDAARSIFYMNKCLEIRMETNNKSGEGTSLSNLSSIYHNLGDITKALEYLQKSLKVREEINDKEGIAYSLNDFGSIYHEQGDVAAALNFYERSLKMRKEIGDRKGVASTLGNIGFIYKNQNEIDKALEYYQQGMKILEELNDKKGVALLLINIGVVYKRKGNFEKALECYTKSLAILEETNDKQHIANVLINLASLMLQQDKPGTALTYANRSLNIAQQMAYPQNIRDAARMLTKIYKKQNNAKEALAMFELEIKMSDSINNTETKKASIKTQLKYEYEKKTAADSVKNAEEQKVKDAQLTAQTASLKQEKFQRYSLVVGLLIVLSGLVFVINRFRVTSKQKKIIEEQKIVVDQAFEKLHEKNKEVIDSINYAGRIQRALLTHEKYIDSHLRRMKMVNKN